MSECEKEVSTLDLYRERMKLKDELRAMETKYERIERRYDRMRQCFDMLKSKYDEQNAELEGFRAMCQSDVELDDLFKVNKAEKEDLPPGLSRYMQKLVKETRVFLEVTSFRQFYDAIAGLVIGQDEGLSLLLMGVYRYLRSIAKDGCPKKNNIILSGPSGSGKTATLRALKTYLAQKIPSFKIVHDDVSGLTTSGFRGREASSILSGLNSDGVALVWLSEFDKLIRPRHTSAGENTSLDVQGEILSMLEGVDYKLPKGETISTSGIMFICDGSFSDIRLNKKNESRKSAIGFITEKNGGKYNAYDEITREEILEYGCTPELLGRFSTIICYRTISEKAVKLIIEQCRIRVADSLGADIILAREYIDVLTEKANGEYGCRLLEAEIYNAALAALRDSCFQGNSDNVSIVLNLNSYDIKETERDNDVKVVPEEEQ